MNRESALQVQAWQDGELSGVQAIEAERLVRTDPEATALVSQWRALDHLLSVGELSRPVPVERERYWADIARQLEVGKPHPPTPPARNLPRWLRLLAPAAVGAALLITLLLQLPTGPALSATYAEVDSPMEEVGAMVFRSENARMTVVWVDTQ